MSEKKINSENSLEKAKLPKPLKAVKPPVKNTTQVKLKSLKKKTSTFWTKIKIKIDFYYETLKKNLFNREIYVKGKEPPKSYAHRKNFYGLYVLFLFYSFVLILGIHDPANLIFKIFMFGNAFAFANAILLFFLTLSLLLNIDKIRLYIFEEKTLLKQPLIFGSLIALYYLLFLFISTNFNMINYMLVLSMIWLILLSIRFYTLSRKTSTIIEAKFIAKYSSLRYVLASIIPFLILGVLVIISLVYRSLLVFIALEFFAEKDPQGAIKVYNLGMRIVMPLIYFSLVLTLIFILFEFIFTRRRAETKKAGCYDNFTFSLIVLFIFFFQIFQISIFFILRPEFISALKNTVGETSAALAYLFLLQFAISMFFLYRIIKKVGGAFEWRILFFKRDGLILFFLACVFAQTFIGFTLSSRIENQKITAVGTILMADKYIISVLMIIFLGITLLIYYAKPHETSMFMRMQKETVKEEEKSMDIIYRIIKSEYIRRGEPYPLEILDRELIKATKLSKGVIYSLIRRLETQIIDLAITRKTDKFGRTIQIIDFISVTEQFEKKSTAFKKARHFISTKLIETTSAEKRETLILSNKDLKTDKASDQFISSLTSEYSKKQKTEKLFKQKQKQQIISFKEGELPDYLKYIILEILKKEYIFRIENPEKYPDFHYPISQIVGQIQRDTKIQIGDIYPILEKLSRTDLELILLNNPEEPEDKKIKFFPISDDNINYALSNFRPEEYSEVKIKVTKIFQQFLKVKRSNTVIANIKRKIPNKTEDQKFWRELLSTLFDYFPEYEKELEYIPNRVKLRKQIEKIAKVYEEKQKILSDIQYK